jgi:hypothetical protein
MDAVRRPFLASLALLCALLAGCDDGSSDGAAPPTSRTGGSEDATTSTVPGVGGGFIGAWPAGEKDLWGLVKEPCPRPGADSARCAAVARSTDGGGEWTRLARVDAATDGRTQADSVSAVHFAETTHGWVYDRSLFATFNGGKRWQRVDLGEPVVAVESSEASVYALVGNCPEGVGDCRGPMRLFEGTITTGRWRFVTLGFDLPPTDTGSLVVSRSDVYALAVGKNLEQTFMARTGAGRWERRPLPCPRALVAGIEAEQGLVAACRPSSSSAPVELLTSSDGGKTWAVVWQHTFPNPITSLAVTGQAVVVALENGDVVRSIDNGMNFSTVLQAGSAPGVRFTDAEHGILLAGPPTDRRLFRTADGGATWRPVAAPR